MAARKATTTDEVQVNNDAAPATVEQTIAAVEENTSSDVVAKVDAPKYVKVKSPMGAVSEVPEGIVDALLDSGYSKSK